MHTEPPVFPGRLDPSDRFRERRRRARRRRAIRRLGALALVIGGVVALVLNARFIGGSSSAQRPNKPAAAAAVEAPADSPLPGEPDEIRGVHVTGPVLGAGNLDEYIALKQQGLNTVEVDVKDENGEVAFESGAPPLARRVGATRPYYNIRALVQRLHRAGLYLIARVVVFEDPKLAAGRPGLAIRAAGGGVWTDTNGLAWTNPYDSRVWEYNVSVARAAARAGFDEIMFDYVRFPTEQLPASSFPGKVDEPKAATIARFVAYASTKLRPLGVRVGAALFGLAATRDLGIGQNVRLLAPHLDVIHPMTYPCLYTPGQYNIAVPAAKPGLTVSYSLIDFENAVRKARARVELVPWLEDYDCQSYGVPYELAAVEDQVSAARRARARGFLLWNPYAVYTDGALASG